ncbi:hypothetical protein ZEAMMB73_Zm00001d051813 [Zea mays]|uniref:Myb/SANT-like domain-containing protein n=1 Tax=Zea mays TaxID=4577 RepID=A0A1D6Q9Y0_MAIZE|nr:hypothetical protein ZEAMMB73_Zm00001d051813 [Zea mays]
MRSQLWMHHLKLWMEKSVNQNLSRVSQHLMNGLISAIILLRGCIIDIELGLITKDMNQSESSSVARGRGKNKRIWTYYEDEELIKALYEISLDPKWKSEGGFKNGYCSVLENELKARLPGCGLSAIPHIESRVRHFRTKYGAIEDNPDAKGLYGIAFPHFDTLAAIYGKDIATGEGAEGLGEAVINMEKEIAMGEDCPVVEEDMVSMDTPQWSMDNRNSDHSTSSSSKRRKKHKDNMSSDPFLDLASGIRGDLNKTSQHFGRMVEVMEMEAKKKGSNARVTREVCC